MAKTVICQDCHAFGSLSDDELVKDHTCPICEGKLLRVHHDDDYLLVYHSDIPSFPGTFNESFEKYRREKNHLNYPGIIQKVRIIKDPHPCENCKWKGTYCPDKSMEMMIGGEQKTLVVV